MRFNGIVVVAGVPGSGKTTLARALAPRLELPLISKDTIKEALFDALGTGDLSWSQALGRASHQVLFALAAEAGPVVLESHFWRGVAEAELEHLGRPLVQVYCRCALDIAVSRYRQRIGTPGRHRGHLPAVEGDEAGSAMAADAAMAAGAAPAGWSTVEPQPLDLQAPLIEVDTTGPVDIEALVLRINGADGLRTGAIR